MLNFKRKSSRQKEIEKYISEQEVKTLSKGYKPRKESQSTKIFKKLKANKHGVYNYELAKICLSWHRRITELRKQGVNIQHVRITTAVHKYYLVENK